MITPSEFQPYLQSILNVSREDIQREVRDRYIPTLAELPLQVQTCASSKADSQEQQKERPEPFAVLKALRNYAPEHVLLVGKPGSGKSTSLRQLLWEEAGHCLDVIEQGNSDIPPIPILIELRSLSSSVLSAIQEKLGWWLDLDEKTLKALFRDRRLLPLLDGLNELPNKKAWQEVDQFKQLCADLNAPLIITTRELGSGLVQGNTKKLEMLPLTETQMREFVQKRLPETGRELWRQIQGRLRELAETPLLLKLLCDVFEQTGEIPKNRGDLFRKEFARRYEEFKPERLRNVSEDSRRFAFDLLTYLAFKMVQGEPHTDPCKPSASWISISKSQAEKILATFLAGDRTPDVTVMANAKEWLEDLREWHLLQVASDRDRIEFHHQMFQEYYAAEQLLPKLRELSDEELKYDYLNYLKWTEVIALMLALIEEQDFGGRGKEQAVRVVKLALEEVDWQFGSRLAGEVKPEFQEQTVGLVAAIAIPEEIYLRILGITFSEYAIPPLSTALRHESSKINFYAAESLAKIGCESAISALRQAALNCEYSVNTIYALGQNGSEAAVSALLEGLKHQASDVRQHSASALGETSNQRAIPALLEALNDADFLVRQYSAYALGQIASEKAVPALQEALKDESSVVSCSAAYALGKIGSEKAVPALLATFKNNVVWMRERVVYLLKEISSDESKGGKLQRLENEYYSFVKAVSLGLGQIDSKVTVPILLKDLKNEDFLVRENAICVLGEIGNETILPALLEALKDENFRVRVKSAHALGKIGNQTAVPALLKALNDQNSLVRANVASALGKIGTEEVIPALLETLKDEDYLVRANTIYALGQIGSKVMISTLLAALKDQHPSVRQSAVFGLERVGTQVAIAALGEVLKDQDYLVRGYAAESLGKIGTEAAIKELLPAFKDINPSVRRSAILGLEKTQTEKATTKLLEHLLLEQLTDEDSYVHQEAAYILGKIASPEIIPTLTELLRERGETDLLDTISRIQSRCQFYNYDIAQSPPSAVRETANFCLSTLGVTIMTDKQPIVNFTQYNPTIGVNNAAEGSNIKFKQNVKNVTEQDLAEAAQKIQALLNQLAQTYPPTTEPQKQTFIQKFLERLESTPDLIKVLLAGGIEGLKILCPPAGIPVEMARNLYEVVQKRHTQP
jgi:HEAT repeat protein